MKTRIVTVTVSDTRTESDDASGKALREELASFEHVFHTIAPDEPERIKLLVLGVIAANEADAIIFTGGTGIAPRDNSYEALSALFDKQLEGFGEAFRRMSWDEIGPRAILSRATAGTIGTCIVFSLPGSEKAVRLGARELILPILNHAVDLVNNRTHHAETRETKKKEKKTT